VRKLLAKLHYFFESRRARREFDEETDSHIAMLAERFESRGMTPPAALAAARRQFGNLTSLEETHNEMQTFVWFETLSQDLRYGFRVLIRNKAFAAVAVLTLALGIGANTAIFSVVNAAILRPLPYPEPGRLAVLWGNVKRVRIERRGASYPDYRDWRDQSHSFTAMAAFDDHQFAFTGIATPERISGEFVSQPYFSLLGVRAVVGRTFQPEEDVVAQRDAVVVLSDGAWKRRFGGDPGIVGHTMQLDGRAYTVIGVAQPGFQGMSDEAELWAPFVMEASEEDLNERGNRGERVLARLKVGVSLAQAQTEMDGISSRLAQAYPNTNQARGVEIAPLEQETFGDIHKPLLVLLGAVAFVLLIASTNVANLLLARSETRQHEVAMRTALGASRGRVMRQLLAEGAILVAFGCVGGLVLAHYGIVALMASSPMKFPSFVHPAIDVPVGLFTVVVSAVVALALGLAPAVQLSTAGIAGRSGIGRRSSRFRDALVIAEMAVSLLLLIGAGLMIRSLSRLAAIDPGYDPSHVVALRVTLPQLRPTAANDILQRVATLPSVQSASIASDAPLTGGGATFYTAEGQPPMNAQTVPRAYPHRISPDFFQTLHTPILFGRAFTNQEVHDKASVGIVTENLVRRFWPGQDPIGKRIKLGGAKSTDPWLTIVGVVREMKYRGVPQNPTADPDIFLVLNEGSHNFAVLVRTASDPAGALQSIRSALRQTEPAILLYNSGTLDELVGEETSQSRFTGWLMAIFAGIALLLAAIGIYGVISYSVARRTREIGLRVALGAGRTEVLRMVMGRGMALVGVGLLLGTAAALVLTRLMATLMFEVSSTDPLTFAAAAAVLLTVAAIACLVPAARAVRIDPAIALRDE